MVVYRRKSSEVVPKGKQTWGVSGTSLVGRNENISLWQRQWEARTEHNTIPFKEGLGRQLVGYGPWLLLQIYLPPLRLSSSIIQAISNH